MEGPRIDSRGFSLRIQALYDGSVNVWVYHVGNSSSSWTDDARRIPDLVRGMLLIDPGAKIHIYRCLCDLCSPEVPEDQELHDEGDFPAFSETRRPGIG